MGVLYSKQARYDLAVTYFDRHFHLIHGESKPATAVPPAKRRGSNMASLDVSKSQGNRETAEVRSAMVQLGISRANAQMQLLFETVADLPDGLHPLLEWKVTRSFGSYLPPGYKVV